jgi:hypothetical protein
MSKLIHEFYEQILSPNLIFKEYPHILYSILCLKLSLKFYPSNLALELSLYLRN